MAKKPPLEKADAGTSLTTSGESMIETQQSKAIAEAQITIQSALAIAKKFPRDYDAAWERLMRSCARVEFAGQVTYAFPRGGNRDCDHEWKANADGDRFCKSCGAACVEGPSVYLAREAIRAWGNAWCGMDVVSDTGDERLLSCWAWDLETNYRKSTQDLFSKLIYRRSAGWIKPDERDLRELTNRRGAFAERKSILDLLPSDLINDALEKARETLLNPKDLEGDRKKVISSFMDLRITPDMLEKALGGIKVGNASPKDLTWLRGVYKSIRDGNSSWADYAGGKKPAPPPESPKAGKQREEEGNPPATAQTGSQAPASSTNERPVANGAASAPAGKIISDPQKGIIHQTARRTGWEKGSGRPEDPLHQFLRREPFCVDSVAKVREDHFDSIIDALMKDPADFGFTREVA